MRTFWTDLGGLWSTKKWRETARLPRVLCSLGLHHWWVFWHLSAKFESKISLEEQLKAGKFTFKNFLKDFFLCYSHFLQLIYYSKRCFPFNLEVCTSSLNRHMLNMASSRGFLYCLSDSRGFYTSAGRERVRFIAALWTEILPCWFKRTTCSWPRKHKDLQCRRVSLT